MLTLSTEQTRTGDVGARAQWAPGWAAATAGGALVAAFLFTYGRVVATLVEQWWSNDKYSFGFLIPWISLHIVWSRRGELFRSEPEPSYAGGLPVLAAAAGMLIAGRAGGILVAEQLSLVVTVAGLVLLLLGVRDFRALLLPIGYLLLMVPAWEMVTDRLHLPFQLFSASLGTHLLRLTGVPAHQQGHYVELPNVVLDVTQNCSGINYLLAVVAVSIPLAYLHLRDWKRRALLLAFAIAASLFANALRVALIGLFASYGPREASHGPFHVLQGVSVAMAGYGALFLGLRLLSRSPGSGRTAVEPGRLSRRSGGRPGGIPLTAVSLAVLLLLITGGYLQLHRTAPVPLNRALRTFPRVLGDWTGRDVAPFYDGYAALGVDQEISRLYATAAGDRLRLYVGYFERQEQGRELINYRTRDLVGDDASVAVDLGGGQVVRARARVRPTPGGPTLSLVWYDVSGRRLVNPYLVKLHTIWNALVRHRSDGAVVLIIADIPGGTDHAEIPPAEAAFIRQLLPVLSDYLPGA